MLARAMRTAPLRADSHAITGEPVGITATVHIPFFPKSIDAHPLIA